MKVFENREFERPVIKEMKNKLPPQSSNKTTRLTRDGWLLFAACAVRNVAYGFLSLILALYLQALGLNEASIGAVFTAALAGGAVMTVGLTAFADRLGRQRILMLGAGLMALAGAVFAITDSLLLLIIAAIAGTISPSGKEVGPFLSIEQAILSQVTPDERRTGTFATYNLVGSFAGMIGALIVTLPPLFGLLPLRGYRVLVWGYAASALLLLVLFAQLSPRVEVTRKVADPEKAAMPQDQIAPRKFSLGLHRSRGIVFKLAALFALDAFAGGFVVQGLVAYWLYLRYGVSVQTIGAIFFAANLLTAISFLAAVPLSRRFGLLNTMVFTHLPSNVLLLLVPFMPSLELAVSVLLVRYLLSQLDVPTRQSYTMAVVDPDERSAAAGFTSVARNGATALAPLFTGATLALPALGLPFLIAGSIKIIYDLSIFAVFRKIRPPEEAQAQMAKEATSAPK